MLSKLCLRSANNILADFCVIDTLKKLIIKIVFKFLLFIKLYKVFVNKPTSKLTYGVQVLGSYKEEDRSVLGIHEISTGVTTQSQPEVEFRKRSIVVFLERLLPIKRFELSAISKVDLKSYIKYVILALILSTRPCCSKANNIVMSNTLDECITIPVSNISCSLNELSFGIQYTYKKYLTEDLANNEYIDSILLSFIEKMKVNTNLKVDVKEYSQVNFTSPKTLKLPIDRLSKIRRYFAIQGVDIKRMRFHIISSTSKKSDLIEICKVEK